MRARVQDIAPIVSGLLGGAGATYVAVSRTGQTAALTFLAVILLLLVVFSSAELAQGRARRERRQERRRIMAELSAENYELFGRYDKLLEEVRRTTSEHIGSDHP